MNSGPHFKLNEAVSLQVNYSEKSQRAMNAMLRMKKLDIAELQRAYDGK